MIDQALGRARTDLADGRPWRAKQRLQGTIGSHGYDPALLEAMGDTLFAMQDMLEAGRYYFWSGARNTQAKHAIALFRTHAAQHAEALMASRPRVMPDPFLSTRKVPDVIRQDLIAAGIDLIERPLAKPHAQNMVSPKYSGYMSITDIFWLVCALIIAALFAAGLLVSAASGLETVFEWFGGR